MQQFTGYQYLLIDIANNHLAGLNKKTFKERLDWANANLGRLEDEAEGRIWKERPLYIKAVMALRKAQQGEPTGHLVGFDAVCSGMQIMSALTGCHDGAKATGLIDPNHRADAYSDCTRMMSDILGRSLPNMRDSVKQAVMTSLYGSRAEPKKVFGEGTPELEAFYQAMYELCPGACELLDILVNSWQPWALNHAWILPDGFDSVVKVMQECKTKIEVDELAHSTFAYVWYENEGEESGVKNAANVVHSIDGYVLRSLIRRCNYNTDIANTAYDNVTDVLITRHLGGPLCINSPKGELLYYKEQYDRSGMADIVIMDHLTWDNCKQLTSQHLRALQRILDSMVFKHKPFEVVTVHDDFKCHANNVNHLRAHYRDILAEMADSSMLDDLLSQVYQRAGTYAKKSTHLSNDIRQSNYALS